VATPVVPIGAGIIVAALVALVGLRAPRVDDSDPPIDMGGPA